MNNLQVLGGRNHTDVGHGNDALGPVMIPRNRTWWQRHRYTTLVWAGRVLFLVLVIVIWQALSGTILNPAFFGSPKGVAKQLIEWSVDGKLGSNSLLTIEEVILGYLLGTAAGAFCAYLLASFRALWDVLVPYLMALYAIPKVALAPLFIIWFGIGTNMKVLLAAICVFFLVFLSTAAGVQEVDKELVDAARMMGAKRRDVALKVVLPASMSGLFTGLQIGIPYALIGAVIGELVASNRGLGFLISDSSATFNTNGVFSAILVLAVVAVILNSLVKLVSRKLNRWKGPEDAA